MSKIEELRYQTYLEAKESLEVYGKVCIVRPTGFGKTGILTHIMSDYIVGSRVKGIKVIYLYPNEPIRNAVLRFYYVHRGLSIPEDRTIPGVEFLTYAKLARMVKEKDFKGYEGVRVFIADECHKLGGGKTSKAMKKFMAMYPNVKYVGATATPDRMDLFDEVKEFFDDRVVSAYTLHDAFKDGILQRPYYCFCSYGLESDIKDVKAQFKKELVGLDKSYLKKSGDLLKAKLIEISRLHNMSSIIEDICKKCIKNTSYMKGVIFFANYAHIDEKEKVVAEWFKKAFPNHTIRITRVTGQKKEFRENAENLENLVPRKNTIDLITSVNMMNMGYHVDDLRFIGMYRGTESSTIFAQQLGRILNSGSLQSGVVFDWVDNIHREAMYDVLGREKASTVKGRKRYNELKLKMEELGTSDKDISVLTDEELKEFKELDRRFKNGSSDNITHIDKWWKNNPNALQPEDLIATPHKATYMELIAKTVAEPIAMRCRQAYKNWLEDGGDIGDGTPEYICKYAVLPNIPLSPYCLSKKVTLEMVLRIIFGEGDYKAMAEENERVCREQGIVLAG